MMNLEVFDPPMCCSSGVCGPTVDPALTQFAVDLERLRMRGVKVTRYNLAQEPLAFAQNECVRTAMQADDHCLPLVLLNGRELSRGSYPSCEALEKATGEVEHV